MSWPVAALTAVFAASAWNIAVADLRHRIVPDSAVVVLLIAGLAAAASRDAEPLSGFVLALVRSVGVGAVMLAIARGYEAVRGRTGLGLGDVKLIAAASAWLPADSVAIGVALAAFALLATALPMTLVRHRKMAFGEQLPFAAALGPAFFLLWLTDLWAH